jgi:hypothetical protein
VKLSTQIAAFAQHISEIRFVTAAHGNNDPEVVVKMGPASAMLVQLERWVQQATNLECLSEAAAAAPDVGGNTLSTQLAGFANSVETAHTASAEQKRPCVISPVGLVAALREWAGIARALEIDRTELRRSAAIDPDWLSMLVTKARWVLADGQAESSLREFAEGVLVFANRQPRA